MRCSRLVIPKTLQKRAVELAHVGHQGIVKTKSLLREKIWFPGIDALVEEEVRQCLPCQAASSRGAEKPELLKMTPLPKSAWQETSIDFFGPLPVPTADYLMVLIDDYSRFPEIEIIASTAAKTVIPKLDAIFSRQGIPEVLKSDNGPPFNGKDFTRFSCYLGFKHRKITPLYHQANGEAEKFMQSMAKTVRVAHIAGQNWKQELQKFLRQYRATPHSTTGVSPFEALTGRKMNTQLPQITASSPAARSPVPDAVIRNRDDIQKAKMKAYADKGRHVKESSLSEGDAVLVRQRRQNKLSTPFSPDPLRVTARDGNMVTAERPSGQRVTRNVTHFKSIPHRHIIREDEKEELIDVPENEDTEMLVPPLPDVPTPDVETTTSNEIPYATPVGLRQSTRGHSLPVRFKDYVMVCR
ncbi:uncharacterized protein K02A2.6-like [Lineus longissimus]|uniref:uncharacterized protein K02A2.6-like n=1 Tax=Lineus longissimus TaxID=88925 RepID=UPI00315D5477